MPPVKTVKIEAAAGIHPYGTLEELAALRAGGHSPYSERGIAECSPAAFAELKQLGPALRRIPRAARLALAAALTLPGFPRRDEPETTPEATGQATAEPGAQTALVVATAFGSVSSTFDFMESLLADGPAMASPTAFSHSVTNMTAAMLCQHLHLTGPAMTITDAGGDPFTPALFTAAGILESGGAAKTLLCVVGESDARMNEIAAAYAGADARPGMEGAVLFVLSRGNDDEACPRIPVPASGDATVGVHGPGSLSTAWNAALSFSALNSGGHSGVLLVMEMDPSSCPSPS